MNKFIRSFSLVSTANKVLGWTAVILLYGYFIYGYGSDNLGVALILLPWLLIGVVFAPFAFVPFSFVWRGYQNFMSHFIVWGPLILFVWLLNIMILCMGVMLSAMFSIIIGPVVWAYFFFKEMR